MYTYMIFLSSIILISTSTIAQIIDDESCETLQSEVHITKGITFNSNITI